MKWFLGALSVLVGVMGILNASALAEDVQFQQVIAPPECTLTQVQNSNGTVTSSNCPAQAPELKTINGNGGKPIITGRYDVVNTVLLRVKLAGVWYVLGQQGSPLTAAGDVWQLDLSQLQVPLAPTTYQIIIQAVTFDGQTLESTATITIDGPQLSQFLVAIAKPFVPSQIGNSNVTPIGSALITKTPSAIQLTPPDEDVALATQSTAPLPSFVIVTTVAIVLISIGFISSKNGKPKG